MSTLDHSQRKRPSATTLESIDSIREQSHPRVHQGSATGLVSSEEVECFQPTARPPMALLHIVDDGDESFETIRIRDSVLTIGRIEGDVLIPHDTQISGKHAKILRVAENGRYVWYLNDLNSKNGTFARVTHVVLTNGQVLILGRRRYRFECEPEGEADSSSLAIDGTNHWSQPTPAMLEVGIPSLVELTADGEGLSLPLTQDEQWVGTDPKQCAIVLDDAMVSPRHARIYRDSKDRWCIESGRSPNGLWSNINRVAMGKGAHFQCGEQRFVFRSL